MEREDVGRILGGWLVICLAVGGGFLVRDCIALAHGDEPSVSIPGPASVDGDAPGLYPGEGASSAPQGSTALAARALAWVDRRPDGAFRFGAGRRRDGDRAWVASVLVPAAVDASQGAHFPEAWPDAEVLLAKAWWESRWRATAIGRFVVVDGRAVPGTGGEVGVMQIKPRVCRRYVQAGEDCADTRVNLRIAATILREHLEACHGRPRFALRFYATGNGCAPPRYAERTVTNWAQQIRETVP